MWTGSRDDDQNTRGSNFSLTCHCCGRTHVRLTQDSRFIFSVWLLIVHLFFKKNDRCIFTRARENKMRSRYNCEFVKRRNRIPVIVTEFEIRVVSGAFCMSASVWECVSVSFFPSSFPSSFHFYRGVAYFQTVFVPPLRVIRSRALWNVLLLRAGGPPSTSPWGSLCDERSLRAFLARSKRK